MADDQMPESFEAHAERVALEARAYRSALRWIVHAPDPVGVAAVHDYARTMLVAAADVSTPQLEELVHASECRLSLTVGAPPITRLGDAARGAP